MNLNCLINLYNQTGAGPKNLSLNLIRQINNSDLQNQRFFVLVPKLGEYQHLSSSPNVEIIKLPSFSSTINKILFRFFLELLLIYFFIFKHKINSILAFGNFLITPTPYLSIKKTVLLHHPYLFDDQELSKLDFKDNLIERIKRWIFALTVMNVDHVVVQSNYVMQHAKRRWGRFLYKFLIIQNPLSENFSALSDSDLAQCITSRVTSISHCVDFIYVSRFYPHKNHQFLIDLSKMLSMHMIPHRIFTTINPAISGAEFFLKLIRKYDLPIINLGEITQSELVKYYQSTHFLVFPSNSETFGNPIIESISYGLPVIAPDLGYAHAILGETGIYFRPNDPVDLMFKLQPILNSNQQYIELCKSSKQHSKQFSKPQEWLKKYQELMHT